MTSIIRDRDDMPIQVGREVDVHGTVAADSPDVVLRLGNPANHGAEAYLTPAQARALAHALLTATQPSTDTADPVDDLDGAIPLDNLIELNHTLDAVVRLDPSAADWPLYAEDENGFSYHVIGATLYGAEEPPWVALLLQGTNLPGDQ